MILALNKELVKEQLYKRYLIDCMIKQVVVVKQWGYFSLCQLPMHLRTL